MSGGLLTAAERSLTLAAERSARRAATQRQAERARAKRTAVLQSIQRRQTAQVFDDVPPRDTELQTLWRSEA